MPIHDWTRVDAGLFHDFHQTWAVALRNRLNAGTLPPDYFALVEQNIRGPIPDVLTLRLSPGSDRGGDGGRETSGGVAIAPPVPRTRLTRRAEADSYVRKASRVAVRHRHGEVVAVIEIVSPATRRPARSFERCSKSPWT